MYGREGRKRGETPINNCTRKLIYRLRAVCCLHDEWMIVQQSNWSVARGKHFLSLTFLMKLLFFARIHSFIPTESHRRYTDTHTFGGIETERAHCQHITLSTHTQTDAITMPNDLNDAEWICRCRVINNFSNKRAGTWLKLKCTTRRHW